MTRVTPALRLKLYMQTQTQEDPRVVISREDAPTGRLRILAHLHMFPPDHCAGSEVYLHTILRGMVARGHECRVIADEAMHDYEIDGVRVMKPPQDPLVERTFKAEHYSWCDLAITHLNSTNQAMSGTCDHAKPLVHLVHNTEQLRFHRVRHIRAQLLIFNSQWVFEAYAEAGDVPTEPSIVVHPIVEPDRYRVEKTTTGGDRVTLVSLTTTKGAEVFYELSRRLRKIQFLGVVGCYGDQVRKQEEMPNVVIYEHTENIQAIYAMTKVILMPSDYESYGRVAVEAACSGIPSIVHPTPGLKEALRDAAIYCNRNDIDAWEKEIKRLYSDDVYYAERSAAARALADTLQPEKELDRVERALKVVARSGVEGWAQTIEILGDVEYFKRAKGGGFFDPSNEPKSYRPTLGEYMNRGPYVADRPLYLNAKGKVVEANAPDREILLVGKNGEIAYDRAVLLGLIISDKPNGNGAAKPEAKMISGPTENKAVLAPSENKAEDFTSSRSCSKCGASGVKLKDTLCAGCCEAKAETNNLITGANLSEAGMVQSARAAAQVNNETRLRFKN